MSAIVKTCGCCGTSWTREEWDHLLTATADWVTPPDEDLPHGEVLEGRQCGTAGCQATLWRDVTSERLQSKESA
jgi:hypothetical protein